MTIRSLIVLAMVLAIFFTLLWICFTLGYIAGERDTIEWYEEESHICDEGCIAQRKER